MEVIEELANQLGVATENLLAAYAPYYIGRTVGVVVIAFIYLIIFTVLEIIFLKKLLKSKEGNISDDFEIVVILICVLSFVAIIFSSLVITINVPNLIGALCSPEGAAINKIADMVSGSI